MIRKSGSGYVVVSHKGKKLSKRFHSKVGALRRLRQVEYFKHRKM